MAEKVQKKRLNRAERRAKQRLENPARAAKMHEARLEAEKNPEIFGALKTGDYLPKTIIGCSGWFYWHWKGLFYPEEMNTGKWFDYYAKNFRTVELNAPFYSWPTVTTVKSWLRQAGKKNFIYTVKISELITHVKQFKSTKTLIKDFGLIADILGPRMGCFLFQLPGSYEYTPARLKLILSQLDHSRRNVVEFRHESWWNENVYKAFRSTGTIFCSCSGPGLPDELVKTADDIYIRFHGLQRWYRYLYSKEEMQVWADKIHNSGARHIFIYFNNDFMANAIKNAHQIEKRLKKLYAE